MASKYSIFVENKSGAEHPYFLFAELPEFTSSGKIFTNVFAATGNVPSPNGIASFDISKTFYAICGTSPNKPLDTKVTVKTSDSAEVQLSKGESDPGTHLYMSGVGAGAKFLVPPEKDDKKKGTFQIDCLKDYEVDDGINRFIGLGGPDQKNPDIKVPMAVVKAFPNTDNWITPHVVFYISWGKHEAGEIIDVDTVSEPALIDFTGKALANAVVTHKSDGTWTVEYN